MAKKGNTYRSSFISIADVLKTGERMSTEESGVLRYRTPGIEIAVSALPALHQGGDVYGIVLLDAWRTVLFIGDVAGHDFSSSIMATSIIEYIENHSDDLGAPHIFLKKLNERTYADLSSVGRFYTTAVVVLDVARQRLTYSSAGHPPALLARGGRDGRVEEIGEKMLPIGFEENLSFPLVQKDLLPGDKLMLYTDGISSGRAADSEEFGIERLKRILMRAGDDERVAVIKTLEAHARFCENTPEMDDCTIVCARIQSQ